MSAANERPVAYENPRFRAALEEYFDAADGPSGPFVDGRLVSYLVQTAMERLAGLIMEDTAQSREIVDYFPEMHIFIKSKNQHYRYDPDSNAADDDQNVLKPDDKDVSENGRWVLYVSSGGGADFYTQPVATLARVGGIPAGSTFVTQTFQQMFDQLLQLSAGEPTHESTTGKGGHHEVADLAARDAIPATLRTEGMTVYVASNQTTYQLVGGITNLDWTTAQATALAPTFVVGSADSGDTALDCHFLHTNGGTDGIEAAVNAANAAGGGHIYIKRGVYQTPRFYTLNFPTSIRGEGRGVTVIEFTNGAPGAAYFQFGANESSMSDITLDANVETTNADSLITFDAVRCFVARVEFIRLNDNSFWNWGFLYLTGSCVDTVVYDCYFSPDRLYGDWSIYMTDTSRTVIRDCNFYSGNTEVLYVETVPDFYTVDGCYFRGDAVVVNNSYHKMIDHTAETNPTRGVRFTNNRCEYGIIDFVGGGGGAFYDLAIEGNVFEAGPRSKWIVYIDGNSKLTNNVTINGNRMYGAPDFDANQGFENYVEVRQVEGLSVDQNKVWVQDDPRNAIGNHAVFYLSNCSGYSVNENKVIVSKKSSTYNEWMSGVFLFKCSKGVVNDNDIRTKNWLGFGNPAFFVGVNVYATDYTLISGNEISIACAGLAGQTAKCVWLQEETGSVLTHNNNLVTGNTLTIDGGSQAGYCVHIDAQTWQLFTNFVVSSNTLECNAGDTCISIPGANNVGKVLGNRYNLIGGGAAYNLGAAVLYEAQAVEYVPGNGADWVDPDPTNVADALDRIAVEVVALKGGAIT